MFWGNEEDERRKRQQEEEVRRRREEEAKKRRESELAAKNARERKKAQIAHQKKKAEQQKEMDKHIDEMMQGFGADSQTGEQKKPKETTFLTRGVMDSVFGAGTGGFQNTGPRDNRFGPNIQMPGQPQPQPHRDTGDSHAKSDKKPEETFSHKAHTKLPRPF